MKLSIKLLKIVSLASLALVIFIYLFSKVYLSRNFTMIEIEKAHSNVDIVLKYIQRDLLNLDAMNLDYSIWDETYDFISDRNQDYLESNFSDVTALSRSNISFVLITDKYGNIIFKRNVDDEKNDELPQALVENISSVVSSKLESEKTKNVLGIFTYNKIPILLSAEKVLKNDGSGPSPGIFILAKNCDKDEIDTINKNTSLQTDIISYNKNIIANSDKDYKNNTFVNIVNTKSIVGYGLLDDIMGNHSFLVKVNLQRDFFIKAENSVNLYIIILLLFLTLFCIGIFALIHVFVINKINTIKSILDNVNDSQDLISPINLKGNDEITDLGHNFNSMMHRLKISDESIRTLAYYDMMTGLPNRKKLLEEMNVLTENENEHFAFLFIDLDNFKAINDNMGHAAGDRVLKEVAERLKNNIRVEDIISRIGGDEFIVVIRDIKSSENVVEMAEKLVKVLNTPFIYSGSPLLIGASIGISIFPEHGTDVDSLIKNADLAMYEVKNRGGYGCTVYNNIMDCNAIDKLEMKNKIKFARENNEFIAYYQPILNLKTMKVSSAESLIRWNRDNNIIPPIEFIPIAKRIGEIVAIDNWMLKNACTQCKKWHDLGSKDFMVSVNISYKQLIQNNFVEFLLNILNDNALEPNYLNLEITEDEAMEDPDLIIEILSELKSNGIKISIDDFGTGYSSLSYINRLPINTIKIDRSLIINLDNDSKNIVIIKSIIAMAHSLSISIVAEGIETDNQFNLLKALECDFIQGYLIGKPMTSSDFKDKFID